ncbi:MAG TPA: hypothetical protein VFD37_07080 [Solirubrobacterales bacterium]|nr:hypothetical protein [Solirubrobacterales bacterium]
MPGRKRDVKQYREACSIAKLSTAERHEASADLHDYKQRVAGQKDFTFNELVTWLQEWRDER